MIGGTVTETIVLEDRVWINCAEDQSTSECAIYVKRDAKSRCVGKGDCVWWQSGTAYWTPAWNRDKSGGKGGVDYDIKLERIGYSGVGRPAIVTEGKG